MKIVARLGQATFNPLKGFSVNIYPLEGVTEESLIENGIPFVRGKIEDDGIVWEDDNTEFRVFHMIQAYMPVTAVLEIDDLVIDMTKALAQVEAEETRPPRGPKRPSCAPANNCTVEPGCSRLTKR